jgi:hypothetical protein
MPRFRKRTGRVYPEDTPASIAWRQRDIAFRAQAAQEQRERFAPLTAENCQEACDWFNARVAELHREGAHV